MARRNDILNATYEAERLHRTFGTKARAEAGEGRIDVFRMLIKRNIPVIFRPMKGLLGAFIDAPEKGIIVTSQRPLTVQRFTAAHELGHEALGHDASFDDEEILTRALFVTQERYDPREIQANAFASQLLTPWWLIVRHMNQQGWTRDSLTDPTVVYQLSLRMGSSYSATCYALEGNNGIDPQTREALLKVKPKSIKQALIKPHEPENWYGDVWVVTHRDNGMALEGGRSDVVVLKFQEHPSSGYLWQFGDLTDAGFAIRSDAHEATSTETQIGGVVFRTVIAEARGDAGARGHVSLREVRPWKAQAEPLQTLELDIDLSGPRPAGLLREQREALLGMT